MDYKRLDDLLTKYWSVELTEKEELELKDLLKHEPLTQEMQKVAEMFEYFESEQTQDVLGDDFDEQLLTRIINPDLRPKRYSNILGYAWKIAAALIILLLAWVMAVKIDNAQQIPIYAQDTFDDPQTAYLETKKALMMLSQQLNKGEEYINEISIFNEATKKIEQN